jgi:mitochondrial fission protein ELM1
VISPHQVTTKQMLNAIILSDGLPGHYNQSLGVVERIPNCNYHWLEVKFRSKRRDNLLRMLMCLFGGLKLRDQQIKRWLRMVLEPISYAEILAIKEADVVISTGSSVAAVNLLVGQLFNAKTVTCRRPSPLGTRHFDLAILPQMYWPRRENRNICKTIGVPNRINSEKLNALCQELERDVPLTAGIRIGVLIGGDDRYDTITEQTATQLIDVLQRTVADLDGELLLTTSRRTPRPVEDLIAQRLSDPSRCPLLVLAHQQDTSHWQDTRRPSEPRQRFKSSIARPVEAIFALSHLILVTEDSFSMVCEAASSGQQTLIVKIDHKTRRRPKRCQVYPEIIRHASVEWCHIDELETVIRRVLEARTPIKPLCDTEMAAEAVQQLLV